MTIAEPPRPIADRASWVKSVASAPALTDAGAILGERGADEWPPRYTRWGPAGLAS